MGEALKFKTLKGQLLRPLVLFSLLLVSCDVGSPDRKLPVAGAWVDKDDSGSMWKPWNTKPKDQKLLKPN